MRRYSDQVAIVAVAVWMVFCAAVFAQQETPPASGGAAAQSEEDKEDAFTVETVSGEVAGMTKNSISLIYNRDYDTGTEYEILIPLGSSTVLKHKRDFSEIKKGDLISVEYEKPGEASKRSAIARGVTFIQTGVSGLVSEAVDSVYGSSAQP